MDKEAVERLSADAKFLAGSIFWMMRPGENGGLTFKMIESKPSPRTQASLDELVEAGLISKEAFNEHGGVTYKPLIQFARAKGNPEGPWPITVPIAAASPLSQGGQADG